MPYHPSVHHPFRYHVGSIPLGNMCYINMLLQVYLHCSCQHVLTLLISKSLDVPLSLSLSMEDCEKEVVVISKHGIVSNLASIEWQSQAYLKVQSSVTRKCRNPLWFPIRHRSKQIGLIPLERSIKSCSSVWNRILSFCWLTFKKKANRLASPWIPTASTESHVPRTLLKGKDIRWSFVHTPFLVGFYHHAPNNDRYKSRANDCPTSDKERQETKWSEIKKTELLSRLWRNG